MSLKRNETYPGRFNNPTSDHPQGGFKNRSAPGAQDGSYLEQQWTNDWDGFFGRLLTVAGITPNGSVDTAQASQYFDALVKVIVNNAGSPPIGIPFYWPNATLPNLIMPEWSAMTFLKWNGATFSATTFPKLALAIPSLTLVESRGEFIRNWDDGRGVDSGRTLLSSQTDTTQRIQGSLSNIVYSATETPSNITGPFAGTGGTTGLVSGASPQNSLRYVGVTYDNNLVARTSTENRGRNISFNFLVRAA